MKLRWLFRAGLLALLVAIGWLVWSLGWLRDPETLRQQVVELLAQRLPQAAVSVGRVELSGLARVTLEDVALHPRSSSDPAGGLQIPRMVVYLDRLQLARAESFRHKSSCNNRYCNCGGKHPDSGIISIYCPAWVETSLGWNNCAGSRRRWKLPTSSCTSVCVTKSSRDN
jgi:hypothetical protein